MSIMTKKESGISLKRILKSAGTVLLVFCIFLALSGCAYLKSAINNFTGSLVGNSYHIKTAL